MKKILLSSAIAAALGTAGVANAAVDLDATNAQGQRVQNPLVFAQELVVPATGLPLDVLNAGRNGGGSGVAVSNQNGVAGRGAVEAAFGFTIGQGTSKYVRLTFDQPLAAALLPGDFGIATGTAAANTANVSVSQGGAVGDTYVVVEVAAATGAGHDILQDDKFIFAPANGKIVAQNKNTQNITYALYETAVDAVNQTNRLVEKSGEWIKFGPGYALTCTNENRVYINAIERHQFIHGSLAETVSTLGLTGGAAPTLAFKDDGTPATLVDYFGTTTQVTVRGSTAGIANTTTTFAGQALTAATAGGAFNAIPLAPAAINNAALVLATQNSVAAPMNASTYSVSIAPAAGAILTDPVTAGCGNVRLSGSTDRLDFALTPGGVFKQMARITNPSGTAGNVSVTVYNDNGDSVDFDLVDIAGVDSNVLGARASTKLIDINDIFDAAKAKNPSFALAGTGPDSKNKLRVEVRGEFGGDAVEGYAYGTVGAVNLDRPAGNTLVERREDGIYIQAVTLSNDGNAFFQTK